MKTFRDQTTVKRFATLRPAKFTIAGMILAFIFLVSLNSYKAFAQKVQVNINIERPGWAPDYENVNQVRYYYLPDIECYYDVRNRDFIYLEDGQWIFSRSLPPVYHWFNLNNSFVVALDYRVAMPWRHFHYYVAHYPRYYYRTVYRDGYRDRDYPIRGYDENKRHEVYNHIYDRDNARVYKKNDAHNESYDRNQYRNNYHEGRVGPGQNSEPVNYYGKKVGKPVKVQKNMRGYEEKGKQEKQDNRGRK